MLTILALVSLLGAASAGCDNACSGHGTCGQHGVCDCYDNWGMGLSHDSGDCSERICPFEFAWVDTPNDVGHFHKYAECSNRGICNRDTAECECFPGYEGQGCQRTACPNDCSGHGRCAYIEDMGYSSVANDYYFGYFSHQDSATFPYYSWDKKKTRGCVCDPEYGDVDCSKRMCNYGTDVMDQRENMDVAAKYQTQTLYFAADYENIATIAGKSFALTFKSQLNETFTTRPINYFTGTGDFHEMILDIQKALMELPNQVIDKVTVAGSSGSVNTFELVASATNFDPSDLSPNGGTLGYTSVNITFVGNHVQGPQNLLTVRSILCEDGCTPKITGLELLPKQQNITELQMSDYNSFECGRRGKCDYESGLCNCFAGYAGLSCNTITALV